MLCRWSSTASRHTVPPWHARLVVGGGALASGCGLRAPAWRRNPDPQREQSTGPGRVEWGEEAFSLDKQGLAYYKL
jgi:hypothetical protein